VILDGSVGASYGYADLIAAGVLARWPKGPVVLIGECVWKAANPLQRWLRGLAIKLLAGRRTWFYVLSQQEVEVFSRTWKVDPVKVCFMPYYFTLPPAQLAAVCHDGGYVFAGGNSMRDYETLLSAVDGSGRQVIIATSKLDGRTDLPGGVQADYVSEERYCELMRGAAVVVVALQLRDDRSAGQQTYLNAMALGKPVIVFDCFGVRDHVRNGETGWVIPPENPLALRQTLDYVLNPVNAAVVQEIAAHARDVVLREFNVGKFVDRLILDANDYVELARQE
jgi:glycosyltransferase involved in cell wall biosynthesis